jgi:hypothetical protein
MFPIIKTTSFVRKFKTNIIQQAVANKYKQIKINPIQYKIITCKFSVLSYEPPKKPNDECDCLYCWICFTSMGLLLLASSRKNTQLKHRNIYERVD